MTFIKMQSNQMMRGVYKEDRNPIVMDIHYKTKLVNIKTKVRAKLVIVKDYFCPDKKCQNYDDKCSLGRLKDICHKNGKLICPACQTELTTEDKKLIKLYVTDNSNKTYINLAGFLFSKTAFRFKKSKFGQIAVFLSNLVEVNEGICRSKTQIEAHKDMSCKISPLTWEQLDKKYERVKQLRVAEAV